MTIHIEKEYFYVNSKGTASTDYCKQQLKQCGRCLQSSGAVYPEEQIQRCVIHMLRNSFKYVNYSDLKKFSSNFKSVYNTPNEKTALSQLEKIKEKWGKKYPYAVSSWKNNWEDVSSFFQFSDDIRRIIYTTDIIEGLNRQYRKITKTKFVFPSDSALEKMFYLASGNVINIRTYSGGRVWTEPQKAILPMSDLYAKKFNKHV